MHRHGQPALSVDGLHRLGGAHAGGDVVGEIKPHNIALTRCDLGGNYDVQMSKIAREATLVAARLHRAGNRIVVADGNDRQICLGRRVLDHGCGGHQSIGKRRVNMNISPVQHHRVNFS